MYTLFEIRDVCRLEWLEQILEGSISRSDEESVNVNHVNSRYKRNDISLFISSSKESPLHRLIPVLNDQAGASEGSLSRIFLQAKDVKEKKRRRNHSVATIIFLRHARYVVVGVGESCIHLYGSFYRRPFHRSRATPSPCSHVGYAD